MLNDKPKDLCDQRDKSIIPSIVIPAFNEADNISVLFNSLNKILKDFETFEVIVVDDGSTDDTLAVLKNLASKHECIKYISFSRNYGHQKALRAGIENSSGNFLICMDADLQHPPEFINEMIKKWREGYDLILTKRLEQDDLPFFKRITSRFYYLILNYLGDIKIEHGSADFRLMDRKVVNALNDHKESDLFYRGILPNLGFRSIYLDYQPNKRLNGASSYNLKKMFRLALNGIISTSTRPLRLATYLSILIFSITGLYILYALYVYFIEGTAITGWTSVIIALSFLGSFQLLILGILGEYLSQTLREVRNRPIYIINDSNLVTCKHEKPLINKDY